MPRRFLRALVSAIVATVDPTIYLSAFTIETPVNLIAFSVQTLCQAILASNIGAI